MTMHPEAGPHAAPARNADDVRVPQAVGTLRVPYINHRFRVLGWDVRIQWFRHSGSIQWRHRVGQRSEHSDGQAPPQPYTDEQVAAYMENARIDGPAPFPRDEKGMVKGVYPHAGPGTVELHNDGDAR